MAPLLYTVAKDKDKNLITANDAQKGGYFFCPTCNAEVILRKSGNTSKGSKRPHFAHRNSTPNCTPESVLHYSFKFLLAKKISECLEKSLPVSISWSCNYCGNSHTGNLLKKTKAIKIEYDLIFCKPDIALLDASDKAHAVIEIAVTHKPEKKVLSYYKESNIILIQINLTSDQDIYFVDQIISRPSIVETCFAPKCKSCGNHLTSKIMTIIEAPCKKCGSILKIPTIKSSNGGLLRGSSNHLKHYQFTQQEIEFAKSKGVFHKSYNKGFRISCKKCKSDVDNFHLFTDYIAPANIGVLKSEEFTIGNCCEACEN